MCEILPDSYIKRIFVGKKKEKYKIRLLRPIKTCFQIVTRAIINPAPK